VVIEAGVVAGYVVAWAVRKVRRVGGRLDTEADQVIDDGLDRLHAVVEAKLGRHPVLAELVEEAQAAGDAAGVSDLTRQRVELELTAAAHKDDDFGRTVTEAVGHLREAEQAAGPPVIAGQGSAIFTGSAQARADSGGIAIGQAASVHISQGPPGPRRPGRNSHLPNPAASLAPNVVPGRSGPILAALTLKAPCLAWCWDWRAGPGSGRPGMCTCSPGRR
jgi:hypothetical protein